LGRGSRTLATTLFWPPSTASTSYCLPNRSPERGGVGGAQASGGHRLDPALIRVSGTKAVPTQLFSMQSAVSLDCNAGKPTLALVGRFLLPFKKHFHCWPKSE
jgi:hypothetical protein